VPRRASASSAYQFASGTAVPQEVTNATSAGPWAHWAWTYPSRRANTLNGCAVARALLAYDRYLGGPLQADTSSYYVTANASADATWAARCLSIVGLSPAHSHAGIPAQPCT
jgi:hypothetical protein